MGAMENKGLNVFNTACVLAKPSTATDDDYERVQGVVAHEYFHNWTGNRVTCRDWFQLTLKEGLTVFRDQHFSQDMTSAAVKRIEEARIIRSAQFVQDAGPMAHPIRPESVIAMDNFYTVRAWMAVTRARATLACAPPPPRSCAIGVAAGDCVQQGRRGHPHVQDAAWPGGLPQGHGSLL